MLKRVSIRRDFSWRHGTIRHVGPVPDGPGPRRGGPHPRQLGGHPRPGSGTQSEPAARGTAGLAGEPEAAPLAPTRGSAPPAHSTGRSRRPDSRGHAPTSGRRSRSTLARCRARVPAALPVAGRSARHGVPACRFAHAPAQSADADHARCALTAPLGPAPSLAVGARIQPRPHQRVWWGAGAGRTGLHPAGAGVASLDAAAGGLCVRRGAVRHGPPGAVARVRGAARPGVRRDGPGPGQPGTEISAPVGASRGAPGPAGPQCSPHLGWPAQARTATGRHGAGRREPQRVDAGRRPGPPLHSRQWRGAPAGCRCRPGWAGLPVRPGRPGRSA